jgi:hypothetical protein
MPECLVIGGPILVMLGVLYALRRHIRIIGFDHRGNMLPTEEELGE